MFAHTGYIARPETKDKKKLGRQHLAISLVNSTRRVLELKANAYTRNAIAKGVKQADEYGTALGASQVLFLNFCSRGFSPTFLCRLVASNSSGGVRTIHVIFSKEFSRVMLKYAGPDGIGLE